MTTHYLKTDPDVFQLTWDGKKPWEIRFDDRSFLVGDILVLRETEHSGAEMKAGKPLVFTGRQVISEVAAIVWGYGLDPGWVVMTATPVEKVFKEVQS